MSANPSVAKARLLGGAFLLLALLVLNSVCTQFVAARLHYDAALGAPVVGTLYQPFAWWHWLFGFYGDAEQTYRSAFVLFGLGALLALLGTVLYVGLTVHRARKYEGVHGTARFAGLDDLQASGLLAKDGHSGAGVYCGGYDDPKAGGVHYLRHDGPEHLCAVAPPRSGKGIGLVIPTLLSWPQSVFVLDRKGENYAITAGWRRAQANNWVLRFDPAEPQGSCSWNALAEIRFGTRYQVGDTQNVALMVVDDDGKGIGGDHFRTAAYELLVGLILHALYKGAAVGQLPGLADCAHMLTGVGDFAAAETAHTPDADGDARALSGLFAEMREAQLAAGDAAAREAQLVINGVARRMESTPARELGSIISTANNALALYRDPIVGENTTRVDFKVADLMDHERPVSLYFITTPRNTDRMRPLARLLLAQIVLGLADRMHYDEAGRSKTAHKHRLLLMLDEFPTLGRIEVFESALAYIGGYGIKAYLIAQDVQQIYKAYTQYEALIANCHVRIAFAPNNLATAEWLSRMTGQTTVVKEHVTTSGKRFGPVLEQVSRSYQEVQRPLLTPDEIMRLPAPVKDAQGDIVEAGELLVFVAGHPVIRGRQILYFQDPSFAERAKIAPPETDRVREQAVFVRQGGAEGAGQGRGFVVR